jgi:hypothetical protein
MTSTRAKTLLERNEKELRIRFDDEFGRNKVCASRNGKSRQCVARGKRLPHTSNRPTTTSRKVSRICRSTTSAVASSNARSNSLRRHFISRTPRFDKPRHKKRTDYCALINRKLVLPVPVREATATVSDCQPSQIALNAV